VSNASSYISQSGIGNSASVTQNSAGAKSTITQDGSGNVINGNPAGGTYNVSVSQGGVLSSDISGVNQTLNNNGTVSVQQGGIADTNNSGVIQSESAGKVTIIQGVNPAGGGHVRSPEGSYAANP
jgi:hypothetical protein